MTSDSFVTSSKEITPTMSVLAGSLSGLIVRFIIAPIDIIKIRLQLHKDPEKYKSITSTVRSILKNEGIKAFWKGNVPAEMMYVVYGGAQFTAFTTISNIFNSFQTEQVQAPSPFQNMAVGALSGCFATLASYPLDTLRTRLASNDSKNFNSMLLAVKSIWDKTGVLGFFHGNLVGMSYIALSTGLSFGSYTYLIDCNERGYFDSFKNETFLSPIGGINAIAGIYAGILSKTVVYPLDLIKRRLQMGWGSNMWNTLQTVITVDGFRGLYRGLLPAILKSAPATGASLFFYEFFTKTFKNF